MLEFQELKQTYDRIAAAIGRGQEPIEELVAVKRHLEDLCENHEKLFDRSDESALPQNERRYLLEDFTPGLVRKMCRERSNDNQYLEVCGGVLEGFLNLMLKEIDLGYFNTEFLFACRSMFDYDCMLHKFNFQIPDETLQALYTKGSGQEWRNDLKEGDMVDAILHTYDRTHSSRSSGWTRAQIGKVEEDILYLEYPMEPRDCDRTVDRWSVEIAQFQSKTEEFWEWKGQLKVDDQLDALDDAFKWLKATVMKIEEVEDNGRNFQMATIGMRVYIQGGPRQDEGGQYDGWGDRFDEKIPMYSPKLAPFLTRSPKSSSDADEDLDERLDEVIQPEEGFTRVWAVPRPRRCTSSEYVRHVSVLCEQGGLDKILQVIEQQEATDKTEGFNLCVLAILLSLLSLPARVYHKSVIAEYAPKLIAVSKARLLNAPAKALRDVRREHIDAIVQAVDNLSRRVVEKGEREKQIEILKLEVALLCLNSSYMERRIQGIRDLNGIIKSNRGSSTRFSGEFLVDWMETHGVFDILFDAKKTHLQLVQRSDEVLKLLLQEDMLSEPLLEQFWGLTRADLKVEVYKIISDCSFHFKQKHLDFIYLKIRHDIPTEKLGMEEFACLSELGKYPKDRDAGFQEKVVEFFWDLIVSRDTRDTELVDNCVQKYRDMVRYWDLDKKEVVLTRLRACVQDEQTASLPCLKLLKGLIQDQSERTVYSGSTSTSVGGTSAPSQQPQGGSGYAASGTGGSALRARLPDSSAATQDQPSATDTPTVIEVPKELTLQSILVNLITEQDLVGHVLADLARYYEAARAQLQESSNLSSSVDRNKLYVQGSLYSHHAEISERLEFVKFVAQKSEAYCITKKELGVIYDLLVAKSCVETDEQEFLTWCKSSCESQTAKAAILDLGEVGEFFTAKIASQELDVRSLAPVGFEFLQFYFISVNEREGNLQRKSTAAQTAQKATNYGSYSSSAGRWTTSYSWNNAQGSGAATKTDETGNSLAAPPSFTLQRLPSSLKELDMLWTLALQCEREEVVPNVIDFLIKVHLSLKDELQPERLPVLQALIARCMSILSSDEGKNPATSARVIEILKTLVHVTEAKGAGDVLAHGALLSGEPLDPLRIKNKATLTGGELIVQVNSNHRLWDLRKEVAGALDLAPRHLRIFLGTGSSQTELQDKDNGKTLATLGIVGGEALTASKQAVETEHIPNAPLIGSDGELTPAARAVFGGWYDRFLDSAGCFSRESAAKFIQACCGDLPNPSDQRITTLFQTYDGNSDGNIEKQEFLGFYKTCSRGEKALTVRENLRSFNVRPDLKKMSAVQDEAAPTADELPRHLIPRDQDNFDSLMSLLERGDEKLAEGTWELIQMLATNFSFYRQVLNLDIAKKAGLVDWSKFFDPSSSYQLLYTLQIVQAVLQDYDCKVSQNKVMIPNASEFPGGQRGGQLVSKAKTDSEAQESNDAKCESCGASAQEDAQLRAQWAEEFLEQGGFEHILKDFMACTVPLTASQPDEAWTQSVQLKYVAFMLRLLRTFIMAAFSTRDADAYQAATLARRSSSVRGEGGEPVEAEAESTGTSLKQLQTLLDGPLGTEIAELVDYAALQSQILRVTSQVLSKPKLLFEDRLIVENALNLWLGCLLHRGELYHAFAEPAEGGPNPDEFLLTGLLYCPYETVREEFKQTLSALCSSAGPKMATDQLSPLHRTLKLLSNNFSLISQYPCKQYFELFCELIDKHFLEAKVGGSQSAAVIDSDALLSAVIASIREENQKAQRARAEGQGSSDSGSNAEESAGLFQGLIKLAGKILDNWQDPREGTMETAGQSGAQQRGLVQEIFTRFLFPTVFGGEQSSSSSKQTMAQVIESRLEKKKSNAPKGQEGKGAAYKLLNSLLRRDPELMDFFLKKCMQPLLAHIERTDGWNYTPPSATERSQEYVGLRNLGAICYMNSMLQQFFMIPALRYNLLCVEDQVPQDLKEYKGETVDDNLLHQLQKLMANLEVSDRSDYNPWEFCFAFKEFDGTPTNTGEQKDAQEFLNLAFDRLEEALKGTSRQHLLQSVFGGQTCSQLVCKECGKVKNRLEDFYNLSLTVKDLKGVHESLAKLVEGEVISDYECSGCQKKVDVSKRTLIAQTPNVLIVHLQRIIFNFDTFQNDKINQHFEFPQTLDLAPYSYYEVMGQEHRLGKEKKEDSPDGEAEVKEDEEKPSESEAGKVEEDDENQEPAHEDCFEYKLVGVTVHSGTAHAGHYWSYINTCRGSEEEVEPTAWGDTDAANWMEFNDSTVRDFQSSKLSAECFGGDGGGSSGGGFGISSLDGWGTSGSYGKSGYMLFYERREKRPLRILEEKPKEETNEEVPRVTREVDYREAVRPEDQPSKLFLKVLEENRKFGFENDIYSQDFFDFVLSLQKDILAMEGDGTQIKELRKEGVSLGSKASLELLAKAFNNSCLGEHIAVLLQAMQADSSATLAREFLNSWYLEDGFTYLFSLLLECPDTKARSNITTLLKYVLVVLKIEEQDYLMEPEEYEVEGDNGDTRITMERHRSLCARFVVQALSLLNTTVAKNWSRFDQFHELLHFFALADISDIEKLTTRKTEGENQEPELESTSPGARIGLEFFCKIKYIEKASDFMLGKKSPLRGENESRAEFGGTYAHPDFSAVIKLLTNLITDNELQAKYPMTQAERRMILHPDLLKTVLGSASAGKGFGKCLAEMCADDARLSRKVCKVFLRALEQAHLDTVKGYLKALKPFLRADDSLKAQKLEWVFGIPEIVSRKLYGADRCRYGVELVDKINEESTKFVSPILLGSGGDDALLAQIARCKGRFDVQCICCLKELLSLMRKDRTIAHFIYHLPPTSYQCARYTDWFRPYLQEQLDEGNAAARTSTSTNSYYKNKYDLLEKALAHLDALEPTFAEFQLDQEALLDKCLQGGEVGFTDLAEQWAGAKCAEVTRHFPPQMIVGKQVEDDKTVLVDDSHPQIRVEISAVDCEYAYSAPTGMFNLQLPDIEVRTSHYQTQSYEAYQRNLAAEAAKKESEDKPEKDGDVVADPQDPPKEDKNTRDWDETKREGECILKVVLVNKSQSQDVKVWFRLGVKQTCPASQVNFRVAESARKVQIFAKNTKIVETLVKVDPTKGYFIKNTSDLQIELECIVKNANNSSTQQASNNTRQVHYAVSNDLHDVGVGASGVDNEYDDGDREEDDMAYMRYQNNPQYDGYAENGGVHGEENMLNLMNLQPQQLLEPGQRRRSDDSTDAVADGGRAGGSDHNSTNDRNEEDLYADGDGNGTDCQDCGTFNPAGTFQCTVCGVYLGQN